MNSESDTTSLYSCVQPTATCQQLRTKRIYKRKTKERVKRWTDEECELYRIFIRNNLEIMNDPVHKRTTKIFLLMSDFIESKTPSQCRSHHQKFFSKLNLDSEDSFFEENNELNTNESLPRSHSSVEIEFPWEEEKPFQDFEHFLADDKEILPVTPDDEPFWSEFGFQQQNTEFFCDFDNKFTFMF